MAASSQVYQNKRGRDEYLSSGFASPNAKRTHRSGVFGHDSYLMALLDKIDDMDNKNINPEHSCHTVMTLNGVIKPPEDEIPWKGAQTDHNIESTGVTGISEQMGSNVQGHLTPDGDSEATMVTSDIGDFAYYDDLGGELCFFVDHFTTDEIGIMQNHIDGVSIPNTMYLDALHVHAAETTDVFYGFLWEDDLWQLN